VRTDNKILNKLVLVFSALSCEMDYLVNEGEIKYTQGLLYYGEGNNYYYKG
jgi:WASH complex subunit 7